METRVCSKCKQEKSITEFSPRKKKSGWVGLKVWCKSCSSAAQRARYAADPTINQRALEAKHNDPGFPAYRREYDARRYASLSEEEKAQSWEGFRLWAEANPDRVKEGIKERESSPTHRDKRRRQEGKRYQEDISCRLKSILRARLSSALSNDQKSGSSVQDLGCSIPELRVHLESKFQTGMTWENWGKGEECWNIDHIMPLSAFNLSDRQHFLLACNYLNLQPLWKTDNLKKSDTYPTFSWMQDAI